MPKVSVVIPCYNVEKYIKQCLNSVIDQTLQDIEIICVNDGSTDKTLDILKEYAAKDNRLIILDKKNGGLSSARNYALNHINSPLTYFLDSDDYIEADLLQQAINKFEQHDIDYYCFESKAFNDNDKIEQSLENINNYLKIKFSGVLDVEYKTCINTNIHVWNKIFKTEKIKKHNIQFIEGLLYEDIYFVWYYYFLSKKTYYDSKIYHHYRIRPNSIMEDSYKQKSFLKAKCHLLNWQELLRTISKDKKLFYSHYDQLSELLIMYKNITLNLVEKDEKQKVKKLYRECKRELLLNYGIARTFFKSIFSIKMNTATNHFIIVIFGIRLNVKVRGNHE